MAVEEPKVQQGCDGVSAWKRGNGGGEHMTHLQLHLQESIVVDFVETFEDVIARILPVWSWYFMVFHNQ